MQAFPDTHSKHGRILLLLALVATVVVSAGGIKYPFVFDDPEQIVNNTAVHSWEFAARYFVDQLQARWIEYCLVALNVAAASPHCRHPGVHTCAARHQG